MSQFNFIDESQLGLTESFQKETGRLRREKFQTTTKAFMHNLSEEKMCFSIYMQISALT